MLNYPSLIPHPVTLIWLQMHKSEYIGQYYKNVYMGIYLVCVDLCMHVHSYVSMDWLYPTTYCLPLILLQGKDEMVYVLLAYGSFIQFV